MTQKTNQGGLGSSKEWETEKKVKNIPDAMKIMKINFIAIVVLTLVRNLEESNNDIIFSRCKANETRKDLRFGRSFENQMKTEMIKMKKQFRKKNLPTQNKEENQQIHPHGRRKPEEKLSYHSMVEQQIRTESSRKKNQGQSGSNHQ